MSADRCDAWMPVAEMLCGRVSGHTGKHKSVKSYAASLKMANNPKYYRSQTLWRYGISEEMYKSMLADQRGGCAICGCTEEENGKALAVDHDHSCCSGKKTCGSCIRGLLCNKCNSAIGFLNDSPYLAVKAAEYLKGMTSYECR